MSKTCSVEGCNGKHQAKGYCNRHYKQFKKYGHILEITQHITNEIIDCGDYAEMILCNRQGEEVGRAMIDLEYVDVVKDYKWRLNNYGYVVNDKVGKLHRFLMNPGEGLVIDHINRNRLDNRTCNLRTCTPHENCLNKSTQCNNISGYPGVSWDKTRNKWLVHITFNRKQIHLGRFNTLEEAIEARKQAEVEYFGEYAPNVDKE